MFPRLKKFAVLGAGKQLLLVRIWLLLAAARLRLLRLGLSHFTSHLTHHRTIPGTQRVSADQLAQALELGQLVAIAARYTPWQSHCLTQVLVLQQLLAQRNIPGCFSLGVRKAHSNGPEALDAHAWLQCGDAIVNGSVPGLAYTTLSTFSWGLQA